MTSRRLRRRGNAPMSGLRATRRAEKSGGLAKGLGWYATFLVLAVALFVVIDHYTGLDVVAATGRFLWNGLAVVANGATRAAGGLLALLAKGVGWRRLTRIATAIMGVGLSYSGGVILSERGVRRAKGWTGKLRLALATLHRRWLALHLVWKLAIVAALIASQVYLHFLLILFPIAFLIPVVRRLWVQVADMLFGQWYWKSFGRAHRAAVAFLRRQPGVRHVIGGVRLTRIRYLCAWRLWKYDPRYRRPETRQAPGELHRADAPVVARRARQLYRPPPARRPLAHATAREVTKYCRRIAVRPPFCQEWRRIWAYPCRSTSSRWPSRR